MARNYQLESEISELEKRVEILESISAPATHDFTNDTLSSILKRMNAVQSLVDQIEIEIDKLEMRVSAIEHVDFRLRTSGQ
ncbi:MAG: hypothetical protein ACFFEK_00945 [Candidatus Thorarchaeota archaeon]